MEYEEPNDNFTFWFLVGVVVFFAVFALIAWRMNREQMYIRTEPTPVIENKTGGDEPPVWECPTEPCKG